MRIWCCVSYAREIVNQWFCYRKLYCELHLVPFSWHWMPIRINGEKTGETWLKVVFQYWAEQIDSCSLAFIREYRPSLPALDQLTRQTPSAVFWCPTDPATNLPSSAVVTKQQEIFLVKTRQRIYVCVSRVRTTTYRRLTLQLLSITVLSKTIHFPRRSTLVFHVDHIPVKTVLPVCSRSYSIDQLGVSDNKLITTRT